MHSPTISHALPAFCTTQDENHQRKRRSLRFGQQRKEEQTKSDDILAAPCHVPCDPAVECQRHSHEAECCRQQTPLIGNPGDGLNLNRVNDKEQGSPRCHTTKAESAIEQKDSPVNGTTATVVRLMNDC